MIEEISEHCVCQVIYMKKNCLSLLRFNLQYFFSFSHFIIIYYILNGNLIIYYCIIAIIIIISVINALFIHKYSLCVLLVSV